MTTPLAFHTASAYSGPMKPVSRNFAWPLAIALGLYAAGIGLVRLTTGLGWWWMTQSEVATQDLMKQAGPKWAQHVQAQQDAWSASALYLAWTPLMCALGIASAAMMLWTGVRFLRHKHLGYKMLMIALGSEALLIVIDTITDAVYLLPYQPDVTKANSTGMIVGAGVMTALLRLTFPIVLAWWVSRAAARRGTAEVSPVADLEPWRTESSA